MQSEPLLIDLKEGSFGHTGPLLSRPVNFQLRSGDVVHIFGPNGGGKTTFLKSLIGILPLHGGELEHLFQPKQMGHLPQVAHLNLLVPLTGKHFALQGMKGKKLTHPFQQRLVEELGLEQLFPQLIAELSPGQLQRLSFARAILPMPKFLCIDELTNFLDPVLEGKFYALLNEFQRDFMPGILMVGHQWDILDKLPGRVLWINHFKNEFKFLNLEEVQDLSGFYKGNLSLPSMQTQEGASLWI